MKNTIRTIALALVIGVAGIGLTACGESTPTPNDTYTGTAVATRHYINLKRCHIDVTYPDGSVKSHAVSSKINRYEECRKVKDDGKVMLENGQVKSYETK